MTARQTAPPDKSASQPPTPGTRSHRIGTDLEEADKWLTRAEELFNRSPDLYRHASVAAQIAQAHISLARAYHEGAGTCADG